jgi:hypothetical protein
MKATDAKLLAFLKKSRRMYFLRRLENEGRKEPVPGG